MILSGELAAGAVIEQQSLADKLGVSTTPLREALRRLEAEDYVISQDHKDVRVTSSSRQDIENIFAVRLLLEPEAARLACENMSAEEIRMTNSLVPNPASSSDYVAANREFHRSIYSRSGNDVITRILDGLYDQTDRYRLGLLNDPDVIEQAQQDHVQMCNFLIARDADGLAELMHSHLLRSLGRARERWPSEDQLEPASK
jgi:DNA-binding GntR family transcriptional regulator